MSESLVMPYRLFIFDADDTLRRTTVPGQPSPRGPGEWELLPGVRDTLVGMPWSHSDGPWLGLASNQDQIGYGLLSMRMARRLLRDLVISATDTVPPEAALQLCPHALDVRCNCRKPAPGMLLRIMAHYGVKPEATVFVGNHDVDRLAACRAGVAFIWSDRFFGGPAGPATNHAQ
jgi:D-glycero-D-manno-heptose 1,7-bisphosphate phosphatase